MVSVLGSLGAEVSEASGSRGEILINTDGVGSVEPDSEEIRKFRGGFFVVGPLVARFGEAVVALPGGCDIGERPVDVYIAGLRALGAVVDLRYSLLLLLLLCSIFLIFYFISGLFF